jgi:hypothetical protein
MTTEGMIEPILAIYGTTARPPDDITAPQGNMNAVARLARPAIVEGTRIEAQEAPQREIDLRKKREEDLLLQIQKARLANKAIFRP